MGVGLFYFIKCFERLGEWEEAGNGCTMDCVSCSHASVLSAGVGDFVKTDQTVAEVETDKVTK